jgi:hypothetical protein
VKFITKQVFAGLVFALLYATKSGRHLDGCVRNQGILRKEFPMALELATKLRADDAEREESFLHLVAREGRVWMQAIMIICGVATLVLMVTIWPAAYVTGAIALAAYIATLVAGAIEKRAAPGEDIAQRDAFQQVEPTPTAERIEAEATDVPPEAVKREGWILGAVVGAAAIVALTLGLTLFDWKLVAIGSFVFFVYAILITTPAWLAWLEEDVEAHSPGPHLSIR